MSNRIDFITQARIDDEKFMNILLQYRSIQTHMNLQYSQLKKKTNHSILFVDQKREFREQMRSTAINPTRSSSRISTPNLYNTSRTTQPKRNEDLFVVKKVNIKAQRPDTADSKLFRQNKNYRSVPQ